MDDNGGLPGVRRVGLFDPFVWLGQGFSDLMRAPVPMLAYGMMIAALSSGLLYGLYVSDAAFWALTLTFGFVFVAPMLAMGPYEAGRRLEAGERPSLGQIVFVRPAFRQDVAYLGLALLLIYLFWGRIAQIVFGLSTYQMYDTVEAFTAFALTTAEGHNMLLAGTLVGGVIAYFTYMLIVVSAPMLLDPRSNVFVATITSFRTVAMNPLPMTLWAALIAALLIASAATGFLALVVVFPWLGLASWRAYRALVADTEAVPLGAQPA
ncbi:DUF2189 domain-containing protein [Phenylobacterium sp.]|jgi:uncharacterized membrane protein|uniref:DUF2189 domain-containing protein n=1 Tax=Phenylobacterium sp. TaxID=1871053 RepID=UPI000C931731|nr:DUF2189 domain-containing protein [Phenylobacterium sp.]MAK81152.1 hypothetical protein [Phenylobacterium sp.]|tara:strand:+ start:7627 stop:8421 length:795 start_codon:yes stop_codon:yes gene_type:complete